MVCAMLLMCLAVILNGFGSWYPIQVHGVKVCLDQDLLKKEGRITCEFVFVLTIILIYHNQKNVGLPSSFCYWFLCTSISVMVKGVETEVVHMP